ncbi:hypothetical protein DSO57_1012516 [Entomophthora muscae]|uniref:Uncharacterized protein n=1 Tax=Entomophthora muscae TaxID=34485 RepID=A0ACC2U445_9FUNG|nr:hypothetical protein DSO57_1012516 [Entomophthora muscae]
MPDCSLDLEFYHPHHLDLPPGHYRGQIPTIMKEIPTTHLLPDALPAQDFSKLGGIYIKVLGIVNQIVPHTGNWHHWATAMKYLVRIAPIMYMAFQGWSYSPLGVQPDSSMGCDSSNPSYLVSSVFGKSYQN